MKVKVWELTIVKGLILKVKWRTKQSKDTLRREQSDGKQEEEEDIT